MFGWHMELIKKVIDEIFVLYLFKNFVINSFLIILRVKECFWYYFIQHKIFLTTFVENYLVLIVIEERYCLTFLEIVNSDLMMNFFKEFTHVYFISGMFFEFTVEYKIYFQNILSVYLMILM